MVRKKSATTVVIGIILSISIIAVTIIVESSHTATTTTIIIDIDDHYFFRGCSAMTTTSLSMSTWRTAHTARHQERRRRSMISTIAAHSPLSNRHDDSPYNIHDDALDYSGGVPVTTPSSSSSSTPTTPDYWKLRTQRRQYEHDNKILYVKSALTPTEFSTISTELLSFMMQGTDSKTTMKLQDEDTSSSFATNRIGARIPTNSETYNIVRHGSICRIVNGLYENNNNDEDDEQKMILAPDIPVEVRIYEKVGAGMEWHVDDILYCPKQVEVVMTLENTSDCCTMWRVPMKEEEEDYAYCNNHVDVNVPSPLPSSHRTTDKTTSKVAMTVHSIQTAPNSILILEAGGVEHKVSPLSYGKRIILKMAFVSKHAVMDETMERHVSHHHRARRPTRTSTTLDQKKKRRSRRRTL